LAQIGQGFCSEELPEDTYEAVLVLADGYTLADGGDFDQTMSLDCFTLLDDVTLNVPVTRDMETLRSISVQTFFDENEDGIRNVDEDFFPGVEIVLFDCNGGLLESKVTDSAGRVRFSDYAEGDYYLRFQNMLGYTYSSASLVQGSFGVGTTECFTLAGGDRFLDEGYYLEIDPLLPGSIKGFVWHDENEDGFYEDDEDIISGIEVNLYDLDINLKYTTLSDENGYEFPDLEPGQYIVQVVIGDDYFFTQFNAGSSSPDDSEVSDFSQGMTEIITVGSLDDVSNVNAGLIKVDVTNDTSGLSGLVWMDEDQDGILSNNESRLEGIIITLYDIDANYITETTSDIGGRYLFNNLPLGGYLVQFELPSDLTFTSAYNGGLGSVIDSDVVNEDGWTEVVFLNNSNIVEGINAGYQTTIIEPVDEGIIGGQAWFDESGNGIIDMGEEGIENLEVSLLDANGNVINQTTTDDLGRYFFTNLVAGIYYVQFSSQLDLEYTVKAALTGSLIDSEVDPLTGITDGYQLGSSEQLLGINAGYRVPAPMPLANSSIRGMAWNDENGNGTIGVSESGVAGIDVFLLDDSGMILEQQLTDTEGRYHFTDLPAGNYALRFSDLDDYEFTEYNAAPNTFWDSDVDPISGRTIYYNLQPNFNLLGVNVGYKPIDPITQANSSLGGRVWFDEDANGIMDNSESGIGLVNVLLRDADSLVLADTWTDDSGSYEFSGLISAEYFLSFELLDGYEYTTAKAAPGTTTDSDVRETDGFTRLYFLGSNQALVGINAGYKTESESETEMTSSISGLVWDDANANGLIGVSETGIAGVVVQLRDPDSLIISQTISGADGKYAFSDLAAGNYLLSFGTVDDYIYTTAKAAAGTVWDSDVQESDGYTRLYWVGNGQALTGINAGYKPLDPIVPMTSSISGLVWNDANANGLIGVMETGMAGVQVQLRDADSLVISQVISNVDGQYEFSGLGSGNYFLSFGTVDDYVYTTAKAAAGTDWDSDVRESDGYTRLYWLGTDQALTGINAGYKPVDPVTPMTSSISGLVWYDENANGLIGVTEIGLAGVQARRHLVPDGTQM